MFGLDWSNPETLWLNVTNAVLGIATLIALVTVLGTTAVELYGKLRKRVEATDYHTLRVPDLGLTMADGGEKLEEDDRPSPKA